MGCGSSLYKTSNCETIVKNVRLKRGFYNKRLIHIHNISKNHNHNNNHNMVKWKY